MIPSKAPNGTPTGDSMLRGAGSNTFGYRNSSAFSIPAIPVEEAHNFDVASSTGGIFSSMEKVSASSKNPKRDSTQREPDCAPEISKVGKRRGFAAVGSNCNNPSDIAPPSLLSSNPNQKIVSSKAPPDYLVRLLNCSGWKVVFHSSESYVYVSPSGQEYSSIAKVLEAFLQGTNEVSDADMESSLDTAKMDLIRTTEETILQDMTTSKQVEPMVLSCKGNAKSKSVSTDEDNQMARIGNPIIENDNGSFQGATLVNKKGGKGHKTTSSSVANELSDVQETFVAVEHLKNNSGTSSRGNVGIKEWNSVQGKMSAAESRSSPAAGAVKGKPVAPGDVLDTVGNPIKENDHGSFQGATLVTKKGREVPKTTGSPVANVLPEVLKTCIASEHSKDNSRQSSCTNVGIEERNSVGGSGSTSRVQKGMQLPPGVVLALPAFNNISLDGKTPRPGLSSPSTKRSDIKKRKQTVVDDGLDKRREAPLSTIKDGNKQIKSPVVNVTNDGHSKNDGRNSGSTNAGVREGNKPGNSLRTNMNMNKKKALAPASVLDEETQPRMEGKTLNGDATRLDCRSSVLPSQPKTSPLHHQGNTDGVKKSDPIQRKHGLADDDSRNQIDWQQIAFELFCPTSQPNTSPIQGQGDTVGSRRSDPLPGRQVLGNADSQLNQVDWHEIASTIFSRMNMQDKPR